jgi:hypothetical protein
MFQGVWQVRMTAVFESSLQKAKACSLHSVQEQQQQQEQDLKQPERAFLRFTWPRP